MEEKDTKADEVLDTYAKVTELFSQRKNDTVIDVTQLLAVSLVKTVADATSMPAEFIADKFIEDVKTKIKEIWP